MGVDEVVAIATALLGALTTACVRLYLALERERARANAERTRADALQEELHRDHKRDLRHVAGLPTSLQPKPPPFESHTLFGLPTRDVEEPPPSTERPPPRKPPRPR